MTHALHLTISTPMQVLVDASEVRAVRAEDESGSFGILPGHAEMLTALPASVLRWRDAEGGLHYCALRSGVMTVSGGLRVAVACREGILGDDLQALEVQVAKLRAEEEDATRQARVEQMRLHANAVRQLMHFLKPAHQAALAHPPPIPGGPDTGRQT